MPIAALIFECSMCNNSISFYPSHKEDEEIILIRFSFKEGIVEFTCPFCHTMNRMEWINNDNISKFNKLPKIKARKG